ncbi:MAG: polymorphic toxin type 23 domain-containing protein [Bacteroidia bacterium]
MSILLVPSYAQKNELLLTDNGFGIQFGANIAIGTHFQRVGVVCNAYYVYQQFQVNAETRYHINLKNLGPKKVYGEGITSLGLLGAFGDKNSFYNPFLSVVSNQTGYKYSLAYSFNCYWNTIKTTQQTGIISIQVDRVSLIMENDIFARQTLDRFRTGAFMLQFQYDTLFQAGLNCTMWTGQMGRSTPIDNSHFYTGCYMDTSGSKYAKYSHGMLSAQMKYNVGYGQFPQVNIGVDAEQIRNIMQNKLIHDMKFIPQKMQKVKNCYIPMLDAEGNQYLYKEGQKIKKPKPIINIGVNQTIFY